MQTFGGWLVQTVSLTNAIIMVQLHYSHFLVSLLASNWRQEKSIRKWTLRRPCDHFRRAYDRVQAMIARIGCMDELISGIVMHLCRTNP